MTEYKTVKLSDICILEKGQQIDTTLLDDSKPYRYINGGIKESGYFDEFNTSGESILISEGGASCGYINYVNENFWCGCHCYRLHDIKVFPKYLFHVLKANQQRIMALRTGSAMPNIQKSTIQKFEIRIHDNLTTQKKVSTMLDKCNELIEKHKLTLEKYDSLIKSRFIEMFGDPVLNPKQWSVEKLKTLTSKIGSGATPKGGRESYISEGISLVRSMNVYKGYFEYDGLAHITEEQARELDNVTLQENDVLINITGASVARCCILPKAVLPARVNQHVSILRTTDKLNPVYLSNLLITDTEQRVLLGIGGAGGATREAITKTELETLDIPVPPMSLQNDFASFVQQIDKSKFEIWLTLKNYGIIGKRVFLYDQF